LYRLIESKVVLTAADLQSDLICGLMANKGSELYFWGTLLIRPSIIQTNELRAAEGIEQKGVWEGSVLSWRFQAKDKPGTQVQAYYANTHTQAHPRVSSMTW